jgi:hypothetical protein
MLRPRRRARPGLGRSSLGRSGLEAGGGRGQVGIGPRRERPVHAEIELGLGEQARGERGLEHADHLLAVGV